jgi:hypothetical protein
MKRSRRDFIETGAAVGGVPSKGQSPPSIIALTAAAKGLRNSVVRKLAIPDLTTTVLTLTIAGFAADSSLAGGDNPRWQRRGAAILAIIAGAALLRYSVAVPLLVCG